MAETAKIAGVLKSTLASASSAEAAFLTREMDRHRIPLDDAIDQLVALAKTDKSLRPALASQLTRAKAISPAAAELLIETVNDPDASPATTIDAMSALAKVNSDKAAVALIGAQASLEASDAKRQSLRRVARFCSEPTAGPTTGRHSPNWPMDRAPQPAGPRR